MEYKKCTKCGKEKLTSFFGKESRNINGLKPFCKECANKMYNENYIKYRTKKIESVRKYAKEHKQEVNNRSNAYVKNKLKHDLEFRTKTLIRGVLYRTFKNKKNTTFEILGYTLNDLIKNLGREPFYNESIDHKIPITWFKKGTDIRIINSLQNLQILTKSENYSKNNTYCTEVDFDFYCVCKLHIKDEYLNKLKFKINGTN